MKSPEELLKAARHLWYSDANAFRAQQILNGIMKDCPGTPEAESAKALRDLIARSQVPGESCSESNAVEERGCRDAVFRTLAGLLGTAFLVIIALGGIDPEPAWRAIAQGLVILVVALVFLDFAISGGAGGRWIGEWIGFWFVFRATTGWRRRLADALIIGSNILVWGLFVFMPYIFGSGDDWMTDPEVVLPGLWLLASALYWYWRNN